MSPRLDEIPAEDFDALVGTRFDCRVGVDVHALALEAVWRSPHPIGRGLLGFSLYLRGSAEQPLAQGAIELPKPWHGALQLFMTPIARDAHGMRYEIVLN